MKNLKPNKKNYKFNRLRLQIDKMFHLIIILANFKSKNSIDIGRIL